MTNAVSKDEPSDTEEWLPFSGTVERSATGFRLRAADDNGFIDLAERDVRVAGGSVQVRIGAIASHVDQPVRSNPSARPSLQALQAVCPSGITCCVGSVQLCCDDFRVIGAGSDSWGCERPAFDPS